MPYLFCSKERIFDNYMEKGKKLKVIGIIILVILIAVVAFILINQVNIPYQESPKTREFVQEVVKNIGDPRCNDDNHPDRIKIRGKILIWEIEVPPPARFFLFHPRASRINSLSFPSKINSYVPKTLQANNSDNNITIFILKPETQFVGYYTDKAEGYRKCIGVTVFWYPNKEAVGGFIILGSDPPDVKYEAGSKTGDEPNSKEIVTVIFSALANGGEPAIEPLIQILKDDENSDYRSKAAVVLGDIGDARAVEPLIMALHDKDGNVRVKAAMALGSLGDERAKEPLTKALEEGVVRNVPNSDFMKYLDYQICRKNLNNRDNC